jgi:hypothetical protein
MDEVVEIQGHSASSLRVKRIPSQNIWAMTSLARPNFDFTHLSLAQHNDSSYVSQELKSNLKKLNAFKNLGFNWNGNNAEPFSEVIIEKAKSILVALRIQPKIFPTARKSIQFEYEKHNGDYLEFEIFKDTITCFEIISGKEREYQIEASAIFSVIDNFYAANPNFKFRNSI